MNLSFVEIFTVKDTAIVLRLFFVIVLAAAGFFFLFVCFCFLLSLFSSFCPLSLGIYHCA